MDTNHRFRRASRAMFLCVFATVAGLAAVSAGECSVDETDAQWNAMFQSLARVQRMEMRVLAYIETDADAPAAVAFVQYDAPRRVRVRFYMGKDERSEGGFERLAAFFVAPPVGFVCDGKRVWVMDNGDGVLIDDIAQVLYDTPDGGLRIEQFAGENEFSFVSPLAAWMDGLNMADLFERTLDESLALDPRLFDLPPVTGAALIRRAFDLSAIKETSPDAPGHPVYEFTLLRKKDGTEEGAEKGYRVAWRQGDAFFQRVARLKNDNAKDKEETEGKKTGNKETPPAPVVRPPGAPRDDESLVFRFARTRTDADGLPAFPEGTFDIPARIAVDVVPGRPVPPPPAPTPLP